MEHVASKGKHVVVVGAGVIGLACALELAEAGLRVTVLERGRAMEEASWAAAGMLATEDPENPADLLEFSRFSRSLYGEFLARVEALSGMPVPLRTQKTLQFGPLPKEAFELTEASLDPRDLCIALPIAAEAAGVEVCEFSATRSVTHDKNGLQVRMKNGEAIDTDICVLACGAWSAQVELPGARPLPVVPCKGQMIEVTLAEPRLLEVMRTPHLYLVPRGNGRVVIGATVEDAGFNRSVDVQTGDRLWAEAGRVWPPILLGTITARWTGLRPAVIELNGRAPLPLMGEAAPGIFVATGHFRNGILLAPGTARLLREQICGESCSIEMDVFSPMRFSQGKTTPGESLLIQAGG